MGKKIKIISWNVNGIRACVKKNCFYEFLEKQEPNILCVQETKAHYDDLGYELTHHQNYPSTWHSAQKKGYSSVATFTNIKPKMTIEGFGVEKFDNEGRVIVSEYESFFLLNCYFPNGQMNEDRLHYKLDFYQHLFEYCETLKHLGKAIIVAGDYNTAHKEIDLARPKENENISGFMKIERDWIDKIISHYKYTDTFRMFNQNKDEYTWWSYRARARSRNVGWRIDYFFITSKHQDMVKDAFILQEIEGSDHCPIGIVIDCDKV